MILSPAKINLSLKIKTKLKNGYHFLSSHVFFLNLYDKILTPLVTEKSTNLSEHNKIVFKVPSNANKNNLKKNIEKIFKVNVIKVNIINKQNRSKLVRGRKVKISGFKKAIITLKKGQSIDLTAGI